MEFLLCRLRCYIFDVKLYKYDSPCSAEELASNVFQPVQVYNSINYNGFDCCMENIVDSDQLASTEAS